MVFGNIILVKNLFRMIRFLNCTINWCWSVVNFLTSSISKKFSNIRNRHIRQSPNRRMVKHASTHAFTDASISCVDACVHWFLSTEIIWNRKQMMEQHMVYWLSDIESYQEQEKSRNSFCRACYQSATHLWAAFHPEWSKWKDSEEELLIERSPLSLLFTDCIIILSISVLNPAQNLFINYDIKFQKWMKW